MWNVSLSLNDNEGTDLFQIRALDVIIIIDLENWWSLFFSF